MSDTDRTPAIKVVGMGPFPLPGEKKRWCVAYEEARALLRAAEDIDSRVAEQDQGER